MDRRQNKGQAQLEGCLSEDLTIRLFCLDSIGDREIAIVSARFVRYFWQVKMKLFLHVFAFEIYGPIQHLTFATRLSAAPPRIISGYEREAVSERY